MSSTYYPLSNLTTTGEININTLIELVVDDYGNNDYVNRKATAKALGDFFISSHAIFNKLDEVFNDKTVTELNSLGEIEYPHYNHMYFSGRTYFWKNPSSTSSEALSKIRPNQMVRKNQLENVLHENALEIRSINKDLVFHQKVGSIEGEMSPPMYDELTFRALYEPSQSCTIGTPLLDGKLYGTSAISLPKEGTFVTIVGKVSVPVELGEYRTKYYTPEMKLWAGVYYINNLIAITELHNIDSDGIAYFSFQLPGVKDNKNGVQRIRIVVPFKPDVAEAPFSEGRDLFKNMPPNSVAIFYYTKE